MTKAARTALLLGALAAPYATATFAVPIIPLADAESVSHDAMNLSTLADRLRETKAISGLRKLSLKGEIDDLLARFRAAQPGGRAEVAKLRDPYNAMIEKLY